MKHALLLLVLLGGAAPQDEPPRVTLRRAPRVQFPAETDSNSPAHWDGETLYLFNSAGHPKRSSGKDLFRLAGPAPSKYDNEVNGGRWIECTWKAKDGTLYGWYHNEPHGLVPGTTLTAPKIGAVRSRDNGATFEDLGIVLEARPDTINPDAKNGYFAGGHGDFSVMLDAKEEFLYFLFSAYAGDVSEQGVGVARMKWSDRDAPSGQAWKWRDGKWNEKGIGGRLTPIFPARIDWAREDADAFWGPSIHWNTHLKTCVILLNRTQDKPGWPQEGIYVSFNGDLADPKGWTEPRKIRGKGAWYPQVMGLEKGGTDKLAGRVARLFLGGASEWEIVFERHGDARAAVALKPEDIAPGLLGEYYQLEEVKDFPDAAGKTPKLKRIDPRVDFERFEGFEDNFFVRWSGYIRVPEDGIHSFLLESDDGARLRIGGELVVDNGGLHPAEGVHGEIKLKAGFHAVEVEFFEHTGEAACRLSCGAGVEFFHSRRE